MKLEIDIETASLKDLKDFVKKIKGKWGIVDPYINLRSASEAELKDYIKAYQDHKTVEALEKEIEEKEKPGRERKEQEEFNQKISQWQLKTQNELKSSVKLSKLGDILSELINYYPPLKASPWTKNGEMRVYLKDESMNQSKLGFALINADGIDLTNITRGYLDPKLKDSIHWFNRIILELQEIENDLVAVKRRRSPDEIQAAIKVGKDVSQEEIEFALNSFYGVGGWDDRDREDFEG